MPIPFVAIGIGAAVGATAFAAAPAALVGSLGFLGFGAAGPVAGGIHSTSKLVAVLNLRLAGSVAAGVQASVYGAAVGSGSLFAMAQAAAMGGVALIPSAAAIVAGAGAGAVAVVAAVIL